MSADRSTVALGHPSARTGRERPRAASQEPGGGGDEHLTRRQLLIGAAGLAAAGGGAFGLSRLLAGSGSGLATIPASRSGPSGPVRTFHSRADLRPPAIELSGADPRPGYVFLGPSATGKPGGSQPGVMLLDGVGDPMWFQPVATGKWAANVRVQEYRNEPVLTWWEGKVTGGYGAGEAVIADRSYRELARVRAANGRQMDLHEFTLTPQGTALFTCTPEVVPYNLSSLAGPRDAQVLETVIQEVDVATGRLLLEWRSLDHVSPTESQLPLAEPYDYMHTNSIAVAEDGDLLVSARHTWSLYKLDRRTGAVIWRLGGLRSDFLMQQGAQFAWQHHATPLGNGSMTVFDDGSNGPIKSEAQSRGLFLAVDEPRRTVKLQRSYTHPKHLLSGAMGSVQALPDGHVVVGWGLEPYATEFGRDGSVVADAHLPSGLNSYRGFRFAWRAQPNAPPDLAVARNASSGRGTAYASWNGATEVRYWRLHVGTSASDLRAAGVAKHRGFETAIPLPTGSGFVALAALDRHGKLLARSASARI